MARRAAIASAGLAVAALAIVFLPIPWCPWAAFARVPCPGCGLTRATLAAVRGELAESFRLHPLAVLVTPTIAVILTRDLTGWVRRGTWGGGQRGGAGATVVAGALVAALLCVWIARFFGLLGGPVPIE